jgi:CheY-like chemotaxis protein
VSAFDPRQSLVAQPRYILTAAPSISARHIMNPSSNHLTPPEPAPPVIPRVLIADQSVAVIERLAASINDVARVVGHATNAPDAIRGIRDTNPHLMVFDVAIAHGIDLLRQIKSHRPPVITIVLTHSAEDTTRDYCLRLGAEHFLDKLRDFHKVRELVIAVGNDWRHAAAGPPTPHQAPH